MSDSDYSPSVPSLFSLILEIPFMLLIGCIIAAFILIYRPVTVVNQLPDTQESGVVYYRVPQKSDSDREVVNKVIHLRANIPPAVEISEGEINRWTSASFTQLEALNEEQRSSRTSVSSIEFGAPMVRLNDGAVEVMVILRNSLAKQPLVDTPFQMRGEFTVEGGEFRYDTESIYLGSLPLHKLPFVGEYVRERVWASINSGELAEEMKEIMQKAKRVELNPETKKLVFHFERRNVANP